MPGIPLSQALSVEAYTADIILCFILLVQTCLTAV